MENGPTPSPEGMKETMPIFDLIAFDADDTLLQNEDLYIEAEALLVKLLSPYQEEQAVRQQLFHTESRNIEFFGYGMKVYALSLVEAAIELSQGRIPASDLQILINQARKMMTADVHVFEGAVEVLSILADKYPLMVITKGDLYEQEDKVARSGLGQFFRQVEVVSEKTSASYRRILERYGISPGRFIMVGNSIRSDILPVLELGGQAVYIPFAATWAHEIAELPPAGHPGFFQVECLAQLPALLERLETQNFTRPGETS